MLRLSVRRASGVYAVMLFVMLVALLTATAMRAETSEAVGCSDATIGGNYGLQASGAAVNPNGSHSDLVFIGRTTYDGHGQLSGLERASVEGVVEPAESLNGTYHVRADCTGSEAFSFLDTGQTVHADFVIVNQGQEILFVDTDPGTLLTVRAARQ